MDFPALKQFFFRRRKLCTSWSVIDRKLTLEKTTKRGAQGFAFIRRPWSAWEGSFQHAVDGLSPSCDEKHGVNHLKYQWCYLANKIQDHAAINRRTGPTVMFRCPCSGTRLNCFFRNNGINPPAEQY
jgi:hypothetical protein